LFAAASGKRDAKNDKKDFIKHGKIYGKISYFGYLSNNEQKVQECDATKA